MSFIDAIINFFKSLFGIDTEETKPPVSLNNLMEPSKWNIGPIIDGENYSKKMPLHPSRDSGWSFNFPGPTGEVDYVTIPVKESLLGKKIIMKFEVVGNGVLEAVETPNVSARLRLHFQARGDDWSGTGPFEFYRWWSIQHVELTPGVHSIEIDIDQDKWTSVMGKKPETALFDAAANAVGNIGFTFGGGFAGHGVFCKTGNLKFILKEFTIASKA